MKKGIQRLFPLIFAATFSGCLAETVVQQKPRLGPVPEVGFVDTGGGEVRYSLLGWEWFVRGRKHDALRRMNSICKGLQPAITSEFLHQDADVAYAGEDVTDSMAAGMEHYHVSPYRHIVFKCEPPTVSTMSATGVHK